MLHEILLALRGCPGDIFICKNDQIIIDPCLLVFKSYERTFINNLLISATNYFKINKFISTHLSSLRSGTHLIAFCLTLDECLTPYRLCLDCIERSILAENSGHVQTFTLSHVQACVCHHERLLSLLSSLLSQVQMGISAANRSHSNESVSDATNNGHPSPYDKEQDGHPSPCDKEQDGHPSPCDKEQDGHLSPCDKDEESLNGPTGSCTLIDLVLQVMATVECVPDVRCSLQLIVSRLLQVLCKQICIWLQYGQVDCTAGDFFIERSSEPQDVSQSRELGFVQHVIVPRCVPLFLTQSLCEDILYVGNTVGMCRRSCASEVMLQGAILDGTQSVAVDQQPPSESVIDTHIYSHLHTLCSLFEDTTGGDTTQGDMTRHKCVRVSVFLDRLQNTVEALKRCVADHIWSRLLCRSNLDKHVALINAIYLHRNAPVWRSFLLEAQPFLQLSAAGRESEVAQLENCLNDILQSVWSRHCPDDGDYCLDSVRVHYVAADTSSVSALPHLEWMSRLRLQLHTEWPLTVIFTDSVMRQYDRVFVLLLQVQRTQSHVQGGWLHLMHALRPCGGATSGAWSDAWQQRRAVCHLLSIVISLVSCLHHYLAYDVIHTEFAQLQLSLDDTAASFLSIQQKHAAFISSVVAKCFFSSSMVYGQVLSLLDYLLSVSFEDWHLLSADTFADIKRTMHVKIHTFFELIKNFRNLRNCQFVAPLHFRMDYNRYFSHIFHL